MDYYFPEQAEANIAHGGSKLSLSLPVTVSSSSVPVRPAIVRYTGMSLRPPRLGRRWSPSAVRVTLTVVGPADWKLQVECQWPRMLMLRTIMITGMFPANPGRGPCHISEIGPVTGGGPGAAAGPIRRPGATEAPSLSLRRVLHRHRDVEVTVATNFSASDRDLDSGRLPVTQTCRRARDLEAPSRIQASDGSESAPPGGSPRLGRPH